jgi:hypothetical protein
MKSINAWWRSLRFAPARQAFLFPFVFCSAALIHRDNVEAADDSSDPIVFSFATVGDSRYETKATDATAEEQIWIQHVRPFARILREVGAQHPKALFFNGDMIMGYSTNAHQLNRQYAYWRGMVVGLLETGTYVVPIPGNHEVQIKKVVNGITNKIAHPAGEAAWRANMGDLILATNRWLESSGLAVSAWSVDNHPTVGGPDGIETDQTQLSYSFDCQNIHFSIINTDAVGQDSHAPVQWLSDDLKKAKARGNRHFFVFGHKMAFTYQFRETETEKFKGLDAFPENRDAFWAVIEEYRATYFCGHEHIYHSMVPKPNGAHPSWQIIAGSGGSPFEAKVGESRNPNDRAYAWAHVNVRASGRVTMDAFGFDDKYGPTRLIESIELSAGTPQKH